ncbi:MAG: hypothetical protein LR011_13620 [Verrucomicrobia bacterium]|nr:hypothetical protein [Verrucomicrobiota bacterium]
MNHRTPLLLLTVTVLMALTIAIFLPPWNSHPQPGAGTSLVPDSKSIESIEMTSHGVGSSHWTRLDRTPGGELESAG